MNYWVAEMTNMNVTGSLFDYLEVRARFLKATYFDRSFQKNWAPRGAETALILYNITRGWVTHNEVSIHDMIPIISNLSGFHR